MMYEKLVELYDALDSTTKRLEKTAILSDFLKMVGDIDPENLPVVTLLSLGRIFPTWSEEELGIGSKLLMKAIGLVVGVTEEEVEDQVRDSGDIGAASQELFKRKVQSTLFMQHLSIDKVHQNLVKIADISGGRSQYKKLEILRELLSSASPEEAKYITRTVLEELRVGVGEGTLVDAISQAFNVPKETVDRAHMLTNDLGLVAKTAREEGVEGLDKLTLKPGKPVKHMLAQLSPGYKESIKEMGYALCETKYDGIRVQIHREGDDINLFTRRLENISNAVPEITEYIKKSIKPANFIVEGEIIVTKDGKPISFQYILQRVRRKYEIDRLREEIPLTLYLFDVLYYEKPTLDEPFKDRRKLLEEIVEVIPGKLELSKQVKVTPETSDLALNLFNESIEEGHEGVMLKDPNAPYTPGLRGKRMVKWKATPETLDLVVVGGTYGKGRRANLIGSFLLALQDENKELKTLAHVATGLDDKTLLELSKMSEPLITRKVGRKVEMVPSIILEVAFSEIVKSPEYESGYSLRFPVVKRIRTDISIDDIDTVERVESMFANMKLI
ncbi:MAG TPA: ATP-dependent DNA ligase [Methanobacterium sp.]|nr:MAG: ATP-dependent DNA ligase [Methanobacterium sp.]HOI72152.1 ATP-dependent DNA ligase [Methanobacterium sp.]